MQKVAWSALHRTGHKVNALLRLAGFEIVSTRALDDLNMVCRIQPSDLNGAGWSELREFLRERLAPSFGSGNIAPAEAALPIRINGDWFWLPAGIMPYLSHCQTGAETCWDIVRPLEVETWNYFQVADNLGAGDVALDVGCNLGIFSVLMARKVGASGRIFAFEPNPDVRPQLMRVLRLNGIDNVEVFPEAMSNKVGLMDFLRISANNARREASSLKINETGNTLNGEANDIIAVDVTTIDHFVEEHRIVPSLIKIDVEGADLETLMGAERTIHRCHPKIQLELHAIAAASHHQIFALFEKNGYRVTRHDNQLMCV